MGTVILKSEDRHFFQSAHISNSAPHLIGGHDPHRIHGPGKALLRVAIKWLAFADVPYFEEGARSGRIGHGRKMKAIPERSFAGKWTGHGRLGK
jgi:hypothetical protein